MNIRKKAAAFTATAIVLPLGAVLSIAAPAPARTPSDPVISGLAGALQFAPSSNGSVYVAQSFAGLLTKVRPNGTTSNLVAGEAVSGVDARGYEVVFTTGDGAGPAPELLKRRFPNGTVRTVADLGAFEAAHNPDQGNRYGFRRLSDECVDELASTVAPEQLEALLPYTGQVDSNPYAVTYAPDGGWYVADAGANAILKVTNNGKVEVLHVPRPQKIVVSAEAAQAQGLPDCVVGLPFAFEPVPTDVEMNSAGFVIASLLPGGPEDASLGARGAVIRVAPWDNEWSPLATGFLGATNVAIGPGGRIYVAELFGNRVSMLHHGAITTVAQVPNPAAVEYAHGHLYASIDAFGDGQIVTLE